MGSSCHPGEWGGRGLGRGGFERATETPALSERPGMVIIMSTLTTEDLQGTRCPGSLTTPTSGAASTVTLAASSIFKRVTRVSLGTMKILDNPPEHKLEA